MSMIQDKAESVSIESSTLNLIRDLRRTLETLDVGGSTGGFVKHSLLFITNTLMSCLGNEAVEESISIYTTEEVDVIPDTIIVDTVVVPQSQPSVASEHPNDDAIVPARPAAAESEPALCLDFYLPESPVHSQACLPVPVPKQPKTQFIDLTLSPPLEFVPVQIRAAAVNRDSQSGSAPSASSSSSVDIMNDTVPEGCIVYDPTIAATFEVAGRKRKYFNDMTMIREDLYSIQEDDDEEEHGTSPLMPPSVVQTTSRAAVHTSLATAIISSQTTKATPTRRAVAMSTSGVMEQSTLPDFNALTDAELKVLGKTYGLKAMRRTALIKILLRLWQGLHSTTAPPIDVTATSSSPSLTPVRPSDAKVVTEFIRSHLVFYERVVTFHPIELEELQASMQSSGIAIQLQRLKDTLDQLKIFVTYGKSKGPRTKRRRK
jgi:hypothetical protein